jgi:hypothetical protein
MVIAIYGRVQSPVPGPLSPAVTSSLKGDRLPAAMASFRRRVSPVGDVGCRVFAHMRATAQVAWTQVRPRRAMYWPMRTGPRHSGHQLLRRALRVLWARIIFPPSVGSPSCTESRDLSAVAVLRALPTGPRRRISARRPRRA